MAGSRDRVARMPRARLSLLALLACGVLSAPAISRGTPMGIAVTPDVHGYPTALQFCLTAGTTPGSPTPTELGFGFTLGGEEVYTDDQLHPQQKSLTDEGHSLPILGGQGGTICSHLFNVKDPESSGTVHVHAYVFVTWTSVSESVSCDFLLAWIAQGDPLLTGGCY